MSLEILLESLEIGSHEKNQELFLEYITCYQGIIFYSYEKANYFLDNVHFNRMTCQVKKKDKIFCSFLVGRFMFASSTGKLGKVSLAIFNVILLYKMSSFSQLCWQLKQGLGSVPLISAFALVLYYLNVAAMMLPGPCKLALETEKRTGGCGRREGAKSSIDLPFKNPHTCAFTIYQCMTYHGDVHFILITQTTELLNCLYVFFQYLS